MCAARLELQRRNIKLKRKKSSAAPKGEKAACHSDIVTDDKKAKLVQVNTFKLPGVTKSGI
jgi:hypothetical protein